MSRRRLADRAELAAQLEWLRAALRDSRFDARLVLGGILDVLDQLADLPPGSPRTPPGDGAGAPAGPVLS